MQTYTFRPKRDYPDQKLPADVHIWGNWINTKTYEFGSIYIRKCTVCGMEEYKTSQNITIKSW